MKALLADARLTWSLGCQGTLPMGFVKRQLEAMEEERQRKQDALLDAPEMLMNVVEKLNEISDSLSDTLERFKPAESSKIFLSYKSVDKPTVSRYKTALQTCGFQPWIDEDEMHAGSHLDAAIIKGMRGSCAAVFFITPNFIDERFLKQEIEYGISEERERPRQFVIIPLLLPGASRNNVPPLLSRFVAKTATDELDGVLTIIKALPIKPGVPVSKG